MCSKVTEVTIGVTEFYSRTCLLRFNISSTVRSSLWIQCVGSMVEVCQIFHSTSVCNFMYYWRFQAELRENMIKVLQVFFFMIARQRGDIWYGNKIWICKIPRNMDDAYKHIALISIPHHQHYHWKYDNQIVNYTPALLINSNYQFPFLPVSAFLNLFFIGFSGTFCCALSMSWYQIVCSDYFTVLFSFLLLDADTSFLHAGPICVYFFLIKDTVLIIF